MRTTNHAPKGDGTMGARNFAAAHVFSTDIADIESEIRTYVSEIEAAEVDIARKAIEIGKRLQFVKENDLVHGQWEPWLRSVGIVPQTARKYIQVYEQFGNRPTPSGLTIAKLFELLTLPSDIKREDFVAATHTTPEGDKTVDAMTVRELRGVVRAVRDQAGLTKAPQVRKKAEGNPFESIALTDERKGFL
ncbi:Putative uncharacterized protein [Paenibacillus sp. P22]|nr:Putative uncharacterized protein [Paenibacillus sp. P22]